ncbi:MAG: Na/Pi symporter, partial [Lachnospiraceae bacterium]|nr:Na/Pi symporter [Lachnospiraceae bacterium]
MRRIVFMDFFSVIALLGGVGCFLFGMSLMGTNLTGLAGSSLERVLERMTTGKSKGAGYVKGWGLGTAVTAVIQSSAATTIMLIGFVNAGIMKLLQAVPVMMGANVGSTVTAQILRLGDLSSDQWFFRLLKPSSFAPMLVGVGAFLYLFSKKKKVRDTAGIFVGLGLLFYGMSMMEQVFEP